MSKLFFYTGKPTEKDIAEAKRLGAKLRDANGWHAGDTMETCTEAYGAAPGPYQALLTEPEKPARKRKAAKSTDDADSSAT